MFSVVNIPLDFRLHNKSSYPWRYKWNSAMNEAQMPAGEPRAVYMTSSYMSSHVTNTFPSITPHRKVVWRWARCHCVCLVTTLWLCIDWYATWPTCATHQVKFSNWHFGNDMHMFRCVSTRGLWWCFAFFTIFRSWKIIAKETLILLKATLLFNVP